jgi:predicted MPP superfamily phosphohydrolase
LIPSSSRRAFLGRLPALGLAALFGLAGAGYATAVEPRRLLTTRYRVAPEGWPEGRRLRIALLTDFHANVRNMGAEDIRGVVAQTNALRPDLTLLLGDYCSQDRGALDSETVAGLLSGLTARHGVHAVQGNHDWWDDHATCRAGHGPTRTERALRAAGIPVLENAAVRVDGLPGLWLAGIESEAVPDACRDRISKADLEAHRARLLARILSPVPAGDRAILLAHEPDIFAGGLDPRIALTASGHTHGGQVRILRWSPVVPSRYGQRFAYGHIREGGRDLVVSAGLGSHFVAGHPLRIGVPPEIVVVEVGRDGEVAA